MRRMERRKARNRTRMTILVVVILFLAGAAAIVGSLYAQENEIASGAEVYEQLMQQLKGPLPTNRPLPKTLPATEPAVLIEAAEQPEETLPTESAAEESTALPAEQPEQQPEQQPEPAPAVPAEQAAVPVASEASASPATPTNDENTHPPVSHQQPDTVPEPPQEESPADASPSGYTGADLAACKATNSDFVAWLQIPGTDVDYPVVLTNNVDYYLDHTFNGSESIIGCLFSLGRTDYRAPSRNIAIYGHHMRRSRSTTMFQPLHDYKRASFRAANSTILLDTLYGSRRYEVFAVINKRERDWDASAADFASDEDYQAFLERAQAWSLYDTGVPVTTDDHILTLITCDRDYNAEDGQLVVMAVEQSS